MSEEKEEVVVSRNEQIGRVYKHINGVNKPPQKLLTEVSNLEKIDPAIHEHEYADYLYQVKCDAIFSKVVPLIYAELAKVEYLPMYVTAEEKKRIVDGNDSRRVRVVEILEEEGVPYRLLDNVATEIAGSIEATIKGATRTANNKTGECLMRCFSDKMKTDDVTMAHVATFAKDLYDEAEAKKEKSKGGNKKAEPKSEKKSK